MGDLPQERHCEEPTVPGLAPPDDKLGEEASQSSLDCYRIASLRSQRQKKKTETDVDVQRNVRLRAAVAGGIAAGGGAVDRACKILLCRWQQRPRSGAGRRADRCRQRRAEARGPGA